MPEYANRDAIPVNTSTCFAPEQEACWLWSEDGDLLLWRESGETIAFRAEIVEVLDHLTGQGWPSFGAVVLLLAACRGTFRAQADRELARAKDLVGDAARREAVVMLWFGKAVNGLLAVSELPAELRTGALAKATLVGQLIRATRPRWSARETPGLLAALRAGIPPQSLAAHRQAWWPNLRGELYVLATGLAELAAEAVRTQQRTGLADVPATPDLPPEPAVPPCTSEQVRAVLRTLSDDPTHGAVARLAQELLAVAQVPRRLAEPELLPTGGYSDIGNRGTLDRLLLSELAHDDLMLATRLALGEALYLRRETPPRTPPEERHLLIDTGVRLWGVARVVACATALALAATAPRGAQVRVWRSAGARVVPTDLTTRDGVVALLAALAPTAQPGDALPAWLAADADAASAGERIVISHPLALSDPTFRQAWRDAGAPTLHGATVDDRGAFRLLALGEPGDRVLASAQLDLPRLLAPTGVMPPPPPAKDATAYELVQPPPLRVPHCCRQETSWALAGDGVVSALPDGRCTLWGQSHLGPLELTDRLPAGRPLLIIADADAFLIVLHGKPANRLTLCRVGRNGGLSTIVIGEQMEVRTVFARHGDLVVLLVDRIRVYRTDGTLCAERIEDVNWHRAHYVMDHGMPASIDWDGQRIHKESVPGISTNGWYSAPQRPWIFDRPAHGGAWWSADGITFTCCATKQTITLSDPPPKLTARGRHYRQIERVSRDGERILLGTTKKLHSVHLLATPGEKIDDPLWLEPHLATRDRLGTNLLMHVQGIGRFGSGIIFMVARACFILVRTGNGFTLQRLPDPNKSIAQVQLQAVGRKGRSRKMVKNAAIILVVDHRGLLHLADPQGTLPAMTLILRNGETAVWAANGRLCGPAMLCNLPLKDQAEEAAAIETLLNQYAERLA